MARRDRSMPDRIREEDRALGRLNSALTGLVRWNARHSGRGPLPELLATWQEALRLERACRDGGAAGTAVSWLLAVAAEELRRAIRRDAGSPPEGEPACAWIDGKLVVAMPFPQPDPDPALEFVIAEPPGPRPKGGGNSC